MIQNKIRLLLFVAVGFSIDFVDAGRGVVDGSPALKPSEIKKRRQEAKRRQEKVSSISDSESMGVSSGHTSDVEDVVVNKTSIFHKVKNLKKTNIDLEADRKRRVKAAEDAYREEQGQAAYEEENSAKKARIARIANGRSALSGR